MPDKMIVCWNCDYENRAALCYCANCRVNLHLSPLQQQQVTEPTPACDLSMAATPRAVPLPPSIEQRQEDRKMTLIAVFGGIFLGAFTAHGAARAMQGGLFVLMMASILNPVLVCLMARGYWTLVGIIPSLTAMLVLLGNQYRDKHRYEGMSLSAFFHSPQIANSWGYIIGFLSISLVVSVAMHLVKTIKSSDFFDPAKRQRPFED